MDGNGRGDGGVSDGGGDQYIKVTRLFAEK